MKFITIILLLISFNIHAQYAYVEEDYTEPEVDIEIDAGITYMYSLNNNSKSDANYFYGVDISITHMIENTPFEFRGGVKFGAYNRITVDTLVTQFQVIPEVGLGLFFEKSKQMYMFSSFTPFYRTDAVMGYTGGMGVKPKNAPIRIEFYYSGFNSNHSNEYMKYHNYIGFSFLFNFY